MAVSVRDVAALAGVSLGTVSNVLNRPDKVAPGTVERVQSAIAELGFVRNDSARQLRAGRSRNDQIATLGRMHMLDHGRRIGRLVIDLVDAEGPGAVRTYSENLSCPNNHPLALTE
ncbi:LacI family DNA-binding transcriptional regulator, partial [Bacillus sp. S34]|nr:LacI family DNA-binding transcriptional regulator [Bacillus sp. S34]